MPNLPSIPERERERERERESKEKERVSNNNNRKGLLLILFKIFLAVLIGLFAGWVYLFAFTGPGSRTPGSGDPDFWRINGTDIYYTGGNVGIATTTPIQKLDVAGTAQLRGVAGGTGLYVNSSGNVGIGTTDPGTRKLKVNGNVEATSYYGDGSNLTGISGLPSGTQGDILYYNGTTWVVLAPGLKGQTLKTQGTGANPIWAGTGTEPTWTVNYDGSVEPPAATPAWTLEGTDYVSSDGDILTLNTVTPGGTAENAYSHAAAGQYWVDHVNNTTGWTFEIKIKVVTSDGLDTRLGFDMPDGTRRIFLRLSSSVVRLLCNPDTPLDVSMDTTDAYHIIRVTGVGDVFTLYIDGINKGTAGYYASTNKWIRWGDYNGNTGQNSKFYLDYLKYYTGGAISPEL